MVSFFVGDHLTFPPAKYIKLRSLSESHGFREDFFEDFTEINSMTKLNEDNRPKLYPLKSKVFLRFDLVTQFLTRPDPVSNLAKIL